MIKHLVHHAGCFFLNDPPKMVHRSTEHGHDYEWNEDGSLKNKTTRDITDEERKDNGDIL